MQVPQHYTIPVLGGDEQADPAGKPATVLAAQPAEVPEAKPAQRVAEPAKATTGESAAAEPTLAELPYPDHLAALREPEHKADQTPVNSDSAAAPSEPAAATAPTAAGEVHSPLTCHTQTLHVCPNVYFTSTRQPHAVACWGLSSCLVREVTFPS